MSLTAVILPDVDNITALSNARIGYEQVLTAVETAGTEAVLNSNTFERITNASGTYTRTFTTPSSTDINYIAIAGHNLSDSNATIEFQYATTIAGTDISVESVTPTDNRPIMITFDDIAVREVTIKVTGGTDIEIAHLRAGKVLVMEQAIYGGHSPSVLSAETKYQSSISDTGQFLGRNIVRKGSKTTFAWRHLSDTWYRKYFQPFVIFAKTEPFFIQWRPDLHPDEIIYCHTTGDIKPQNMGGATTLLDVSMNVRGHDDV